jgi:hypothetical protein
VRGRRVSQNADRTTTTPIGGLGMLRTVSVGLVFLTACVASGTPGVRHYAISPEAIDRTQAPDVYEVIRQLRPHWLRECVTVFVNDREWGGHQTLRELLPDQVSGVRFIPTGHPRPGAGSAADASCPAIQVMTVSSES